MFKDPWVARDEYISLVLDRGAENVERYLGRHCNHPEDEAEVSAALKLLELQRHAMLMYTSCGWFVDDLSGIETVQVIQYAGRVIQLAQEMFGDSIEPRFLELLEKARCNVRIHRDGRHIYERFVKPAMVDLEHAAAHYAISSLFEEYEEETRIAGVGGHELRDAPLWRPQYQCRRPGVPR